ncbi:MAG: MarR family transcriptional regulator [Gemmatimonadales bacterium]|nr:MarR family transcriptional regulator [Gemmatimonadales bacterium]
MSDTPDRTPPTRPAGWNAGTATANRAIRYSSSGEFSWNSDPTATALQLWAHLANAHSAIHANATEDLAGRGLSVAEFGLLEILQQKGPLPLGEVQRSLSVSSGGVTFLVDRLEEKGLVERRSSQQDRRSKHAALTDKGEELMAEVLPAHAERIRESMSGLTLPEQRSAIGALRALAREAAARSGTAT